MRKTDWKLAGFLKIMETLQVCCLKEPSADTADAANAETNTLTSLIRAATHVITSSD